jgi:hypothetical protein
MRDMHRCSKILVLLIIKFALNLNIILFALLFIEISYLLRFRIVRKPLNSEVSLLFHSLLLERYATTNNATIARII